MEKQKPMKTWLVREYPSLASKLSPKNISSYTPKSEQVEAISRKEAKLMYKETHNLQTMKFLTAIAYNGDK